jgi:O-antigen/teichoic acid export membrane protein
MQNRIIDTAKHTLIYGIGNVSTKFIGLLLLPLYTTKLSVLNYGKFTILEVTSQFLVMLFGLNIYTAMLRWCSEEKNEESRKTIVSTSFLALLGVVLIFNVILIPMKGMFSNLYFQSNEYSLYFLILFISVSFEVLNSIPLSVLRLQEKSISYVIIVSVRLLIVLLFNVFFLLFLDLGVIGIFLSNVIGQFITFLVMLPIIHKNINFKFDPKILREMAGYSLPLIFTSISVLLLSIGDRFIIKYFLEYSLVGIYSLAYKLAGVINVFVIQSFALGFLPIAFKMLNKPEANLFYRKTFKYYAIVLIFVAFVISLFAREVLQIVAQNEEYWMAYTLVPILALTFVFKGVQYIFALGFHYVKKTKYNAYIVILGVFVNFGLNFILIPKYGIWGAGITTLLSTLLITILMYRFSQKKYFVRYQIDKFIVGLILGIGLYLISTFSNDLSFVYRTIIKFGLMILFPIFLFSLKYFDKSEIDNLKSILNRKNKSL